MTSESFGHHAHVADEEIVGAMKKQKYRSANKVLPYIKREFPDVSEKRILHYSGIEFYMMLQFDESRKTAAISTRSSAKRQTVGFLISSLIQKVNHLITLCS